MAGFKSFAEVAEIDIENGLTGIVGPNGCGKSNIVEALRWVMGESSARQMRSGEMDDVIFAGTQQRPARNLAEISLKLDNHKRNAPAEFNSTDDIEVTRKIERGKGSSYFINAKPARSRDVRLLFADVSSGARSSGIVSQGRIGAIVGAKPVDRRILLEEAANIRGLHTRRHEAELRLRSAATNLERLDDVITGLIEQRDWLKRQARQAARYRSVADRIRKAEAQLLLSKWTKANNELGIANSNFKTSKTAVAERTQSVAKSATARAEISSSLPPLRAAEAEKAAEFQRLSIGHEDLDKEEGRLQQTLQQLANQQAQITVDIARETCLRDDANLAIAKLNDEAKTLTDNIENAIPRCAEIEQSLITARAKANNADATLANASATLRAAANTRSTLVTRHSDISEQLAATSAALGNVSVAELVTKAHATSTERDAAEATFISANKAVQNTEMQLTVATSAAENTEANRRASTAQITKLQAEVDALHYLLADQGEANQTPVIDQLIVNDGMEVALAAYLADELSAPVGTGNRGYWRTKPHSPDLKPPDGTAPLIDYIFGVPALNAALAGVGVINDEADAQAQQLTLLPGQAITSKNGSLWRWDGFVRLASESDKSAERIRQRRRLDSLQRELTIVSKKAATDEAHAAETQNDLEHCQAQLRDCRAANLAAEQYFGEVRREAESDALRMEAARLRAVELHQALTGLQDNLAGCDGEIAQLGDDAELLATEVIARNEAEVLRNDLTDAMHAASQLAQIMKTDKNRLSSSELEVNAWQERLEGAAKRMAELENRLANGVQEKQLLDALPRTIALKRMKIADRLEIVEKTRQTAADSLRLAEALLAKSESLQRNAESALADAREVQIRAEGHQESWTTRLSDLRAHIAEKLGCTPHAVARIADIEDLLKIPEIEILEDRVQRLVRERDNIGPVNLKAEPEMEDVATRITSMEIERDDLLAAITKLRSAIAQLNREGRERLLKSFAEANQHFKKLFTKLFGGGTAELQLTNADDPLEAGLEIMVSPPGKRLQSLSLLSGGEQALTALAIIFAVFLTNPAPICVLDEVDAPLDDSNVVRFCDLLRDICTQTDTRFIVITHHRMTMARMDRLFGITMEQQGISKLVSVDLQTAEGIRDNVPA